jgi:Holliday junction resolvase-like predicted endonuclease
MTKLPPLGVSLTPPFEETGARGLSIGRRGEALVRQDLMNRGWKIIETNKKFAGVELDVVAWNRRSCLVVEVKSSKALLPEFHLRKNQMERLFRALRSLSNEGKNPRLLLAAIRFFQDQAVELRYFRIQPE